MKIVPQKEKAVSFVWRGLKKKKCLKKKKWSHLFGGAQCFLSTGLRVCMLSQPLLRRIWPWFQHEYEKIEVRGLKMERKKKLPSRRSRSRLTNQTTELDGNLVRTILPKRKLKRHHLSPNHHDNHPQRLYNYSRHTFTVDSWAVHLLLVKLKVLLVLLRARLPTMLRWVTTSDSRFRPLSINTVKSQTVLPDQPYLKIANCMPSQLMRNILSQIPN